MMNRFAWFVVVVCLLVIEGGEQNAISMEQTTQPTFQEELRLIESCYKDEQISKIYSSIDKDPADFAKKYLDIHLNTDGTPVWYQHFRVTLDYMSKSDWTAASNELVKARIMDSRFDRCEGSNIKRGNSPNLPDVIMLSAILKRKLVQNESALADLSELYELHRLAPQLFNDSNVVRLK